MTVQAPACRALRSSPHLASLLVPASGQGPFNLLLSILPALPAVYPAALQSEKPKSAAISIMSLRLVNLSPDIQRPWGGVSRYQPAVYPGSALTFAHDPLAREAVQALTAVLFHHQCLAEPEAHLFVSGDDVRLRRLVRRHGYESTFFRPT